MQQLAQGSFSADDVLAVLQGRYGARRWSFRYELLTSANVYVQDLDNVLVGEVDQDWSADIKRTARFTIKDDGVINYLSDRIKPYVRLQMPPYGDDDWVEWPQGVFLLSSPTRSADATAVVERQVEAYDAAQIFNDDAVENRYTVAAGTSYTDAVVTLLGSITQNVTPSSATLPVDKEWEPGTPKLKIINELLKAANYDLLSFDENGVATVKPYVSPDDRPTEYTYADDDQSLIIPKLDQTLDLFSVPNKWVRVISDPDRVALVSTYTNDNPASPTSTVNRARTIVDFKIGQDAPDQATLDAQVAKVAFEASQVYEVLEFETGIMPIHSGNDVLRIAYSPLAVDAKYAEQSWALPLRADATMRHRARRVVGV